MKFIVPVPAQVNKLHFTWENLAARPVSLTMERNNHNPFSEPYKIQDWRVTICILLYKINHRSHVEKFNCSDFIMSGLLILEIRYSS